MLKRGKNTHTGTAFGAGELKAWNTKS